MEPVDRWQWPVTTAERRELGAMVEPLDRRAEVEPRTQRLEEKTRDPPAMTPMETGRPTPTDPTAQMVS